MNKKIIISSLEWKNHSFLAAALCPAGNISDIEEIRVWSKEEESILGNIYIGQTERIQEFMHAAFIQIAKDTSCYMELSDAECIYIPNARPGQTLKGMCPCVVQISKEAGRKKNPRVTSRFTLKTPHMVLTRGNEGIGISKKLPVTERKRIREIVTDLLIPEGCGIVIRTNAAGLSAEELTREYKRLCDQYISILHLADTRPVFAEIYEAESGYLQFIRENNRNTKLEIRTDDSLVRDKIRDLIEQKELDVTLSWYEDSLLPLYKLYRIEHVLETALQERVWLPCGGFVVIQQTDAFVSIDVNSGKYASGKHPSDTYLKVNLEAAKEIVRQLRLRNLSGMILVDFISMKKNGDQEILLNHLRELAASDPEELTVIDLTPLGIVEMTRKKSRKPLAEQLNMH